MTELATCARCKKFFIDEEYLNHICDPDTKESKIIRFSRFNTFKDDEGRTIIDIWAMDGINYMFEEVPENKEYTKIPYQPRVNTNNNQPSSYQNRVQKH